MNVNFKPLRILIILKPPQKSSRRKKRRIDAIKGIDNLENKKGPPQSLKLIQLTQSGEVVTISLERLKKTSPRSPVIIITKRDTIKTVAPRHQSQKTGISLGNFYIGDWY